MDGVGGEEGEGELVCGSVLGWMEGWFCGGKMCAWGRGGSGTVVGVSFIDWLGRVECDEELDLILPKS